MLQTPLSTIYWWGLLTQDIRKMGKISANLEKYKKIKLILFYIQTNNNIK
jgi:hypothetical protein